MLKAAILNIELFGPPKFIVFQYNPEKVSRSLQAQAAQGEGERSEVMRLAGAPVETIRFEEVAFDAADLMAKRDAIAATMGIYPQLAQLELMLYPSAATVVANTILMAAGSMEIIAPEGPFTLLSWGAQRTLPVRLTELSINEEAFDSRLSPIRATLSLGFRVLSYNDFPITHPGYYTFLIHQVLKEVQAGIATARAIESVIAGEVTVVVP